jgi:hypothetical protein
MVLQPSLVALARQNRQRTPPPPVSPLRDASSFDSPAAHQEYMKTRRAALERLREFNRPKRKRERRVAASKPSKTSQKLTDAVDVLRVRERRVFLGLDVETGRKKGPSFVHAIGRQAIQDTRQAMCDGGPEARHPRYQQSARELPKLTSAAAVRDALAETEEWSRVTLSQVRRAVTSANKRERGESGGPLTLSERRRRGELAYYREKRRSTINGLSAKRSPAYPAMLERKRQARRDQPQDPERAQLKAKQLAIYSAEQWAYEICRKDEQTGLVNASDDRWYLGKRRIDAEYALRAARRAAADWAITQKCCSACGRFLPQWEPRDVREDERCICCWGV